MQYSHKIRKENIDLKEIVRQHKNASGKLRADDIKFQYKYIRRKYGEEGLKKVEKAVLDAGYNLPDVDKLSHLEWVPIGISTILICAYVEVFDWTEKEIFQMGYDSISFKKVPYFFFRYFISPEKTFSIAAKSFKNYSTVGGLNFYYYDKKKREIMARLENFKTHPTTCLFLAGFFTRIAELALGLKNIKITETKCVHRGDPYHEFVLNF